MYEIARHLHAQLEGQQRNFLVCNRQQETNQRLGHTEKQLYAQSNPEIIMFATRVKNSSTHLIDQTMLVTNSPLAATRPA
jgi:hypothetical protein